MGGGAKKRIATFGGSSLESPESLSSLAAVSTADPPVAIAQGSAELNIPIAVARADEEGELKAIHGAFFPAPERILSLCLAGYGRVGKALAGQLDRAGQKLLASRGLDIRLCGISNSKHMAFDRGGFSAGACAEALAGGRPSDPRAFVEGMLSLDLPNPVYIDCTASAEVAATYPRVLDGGVAVVAANKIANSSDLRTWRGLHGRASQEWPGFFYEANVGAGLPIIGTLKDLAATGDRVERIEAILSGTISFIFNNFKAGRSFSSLVKEARERGYTEPDPRVDLSALDAARKTLILARELGLGLELADISIHPLIPPACAAATGVEDFLQRLEEADPWFEELKRKAEAEGRVLRYVSLIEEGKASIVLRSLGPEHPFAALDGSDNIIAFTTARYADRPLVVKGPGAGAEVTAAGVFADILKASAFMG